MFSPALQAAYYDASVVLAEHDFSYDDEERQEVYTKIDIMEGEMKSVIEEEHMEDDRDREFGVPSCILCPLQSS